MSKKTIKPGATFDAYILAVGIRSAEFTYDGHLLYQNIEYFRRCRDAGLSPYKALLFLGDYLKGEYKI